MKSFLQALQTGDATMLKRWLTEGMNATALLTLQHIPLRQALPLAIVLENIPFNTDNLNDWQQCMQLLIREGACFTDIVSNIMEDWQPQQTLLQKLIVNYRGLRSTLQRSRFHGFDSDTPQEITPEEHARNALSQWMMREIIAQAPDELNRTDSLGDSPLLAALREEKVALAKIFIEAGADATRRSSTNHNSALHYASRCEDAEEIMDMLLTQGVMLEAENQQQQTALEVSHLPKNILFLLQKGAALRPHVFMRIWTLAQSDSDLITYLLEHTDAPRLADPQGKTLLHQVDSPNLITMLISVGADVNAIDTGGNTPLLYALRQSDSLPLVEALLAHGANANQANIQGITPLMALMQYNLFGMKTISMLQNLQHRGARLDSSDDQGKSLLHLAISHPLAVLQFLLAHGLFINARDAQGRTPLHLAVAGSRGAQVDALLTWGADSALADNQQCLPLEHLSWTNFSENDPLLKKNMGRLLAPFSFTKIPINYPDLFRLAAGWNATDLLQQLFTLQPPAAEILNESLRIAVIHRSYVATEWLLACKVKREVQTEEPLLHLAVQNFDIKMIDILMNAGADVQARDQSKRTVFDVWIDSYPSRSFKTSPQEYDRLACSIFELLAKKLSPTHPLLTALIPLLVVYFRARPWQIIQFLILRGTPLPPASALPLEQSYARSEDNFHKHMWPALITEAVNHQDLKLIMHLFGLLEDPLKRDYLALAAHDVIEKRDWSVFELLIQLGFEVNHPLLRSAYSEEHTHSFTLLFALTQEAYQKNDLLSLQNIEMFMVQLLNAGFNDALVFVPKSHRFYSLFPSGSLHHAVGYNMLKLTTYLLDSPLQLDPNFLSDDKTPLEIAIAQKHVAMTELLLRHGANPRQIIVAKKSLLHLACESGNETLIQSLLTAGATVDKKTIELVMQYRISIELFELFWKACPQTQILEIKPLLLATSTGHVPFVRFVLREANATILGQVNMLGQTALHLAARFSDPNLFNVLLSRNFLPTARDYLGDTPAMTAFYYGTFLALGLPAPPEIELIEFELLQAQLREKPEFSWYVDQVLGQCCFKLISLFKTRVHAMSFLQSHEDATSSQPVHDACLFSLPETGKWHQEAWAKLAHQHGSLLTRYLHLAPSIEDALGRCPETLQEIEDTNIHYTRERENQALAVLFSRHQIPESAFNRILDRFVPKEEDHMPSLFIDGVDFKEPKYYLAKLEKDDLRGFVLGAFTHCCQKVGSAGEACAWYGMTSAFSGFYVIFKRAHVKDIHRLSKILNTAEEKQCASDFICSLTEKTQRKKYQDWCTEEARKQKISVDDSRILHALRVHLTEQLQQVKEDQIVAQMWAWRNEKSLVFDSWERLRPEDDRLCVPFLEAATQLAMQAHGFKKVLLGKNGNTPANLSFSDPAEVECPLEYFDYRDSQEQWLVGERQFEPEILQTQTPLERQSSSRTDHLYTPQIVFAHTISAPSSQNECEATL